MYQLISIIELSCILSFVSLAAILTFRFAGFPDLSVDGVFGLGAVIFAKSILSGVPLIPSLLFAAMAGAIVGGLITLASERLKINPLLASVLMLTMLYSVNLRVLGQANQPLYDALSTSWFSPALRVWSFAGLVILTLGTLIILFRTELGTSFRCTGTSASFLTSIGRNVFLHKICMVSLSGSFVALAGALLALKFSFADVTMGTGTIIVGIASLIIGEKICGRDSVLAQLLAAPVGIVFYELAVGFALSSGISSIDVKLGTGVITISLLAISRHEKGKLFD